MAKKTIVHVAEAFGGGIIECIKNIVLNSPHFNHCVIYGNRRASSLEVHNFKEIVRDYNVEMIPWTHAFREIHWIQDYRAYKELAKILKTKSNYLLHLHSSKAGALGRIFGFFHKKIPVLYTPNGLSFIRKDLSDLKKKFFLGLEFLLNKISGKTISVSLSEQARLNHAGISSLYIPNGITLTHLPKQNPSAPVITIITAGRITIQKNPVLFNQIAEKCKDIKFIWIGDGELKYQLTSKNIEVTGWLQQSQIFEYLNRSTLYLSTSLWEGLPFAVLEAMNAQLPLLLSDCVGNSDLISEKYPNGFLFSEVKEACEYLKKMLFLDENLSRMGKNSRRYLEENFTATLMGKKYEELYHSFF